MKRSIVAVLCAVLVIAAVTLWIAEGYTPEGTVRRYLASLAKGDAETALSMVDPGVPSDQRIFLTNEVMASAASRLEIESIEEIPATAGLSLPALRGDAVVPPTKALPVVTRDEDDVN